MHACNDHNQHYLWPRAKPKNMTLVHGNPELLKEFERKSLALGSDDVKLPPCPNTLSEVGLSCMVGLT